MWVWVCPSPLPSPRATTGIDSHCWSGGRLVLTFTFGDDYIPFPPREQLRILGVLETQVWTRDPE